LSSSTTKTLQKKKYNFLHPALEYWMLLAAGQTNADFYIIKKNIAD